METIKKLIRANVKQYGILIALIGIILFFTFITNGLLLRPINVSNVILQNSYILVLAIGMLLVIVSGHFDLSVGSVLAFVGALMGQMSVVYDANPFLTIVLMLVVGALIGMWQGVWIAYFKLPAFIVTLGNMLIFRGLALVLLGGSSLGPFPDPIRNISSGFILDGGAYKITAILVGAGLSLLFILGEFRKRRNRKKYKFEVSPIKLTIIKIIFVVIAINIFTVLLASYKGLPNVLVLLGILILLYTFIMNKTILGRRIYALGGNEKAAKLSGINTEKLTFLVFVNMGILAALSSIVFTARLNSANSRAGQGFELDALAACFIGGASISGGVGTVYGAIIGTLVMGIMNNGMSLLGLGIDWQQTIKGLVLMLAVLFDVCTKEKTT